MSSNSHSKILTFKCKVVEFCNFWLALKDWYLANFHKFIKTKKKSIVEIPNFFFHFLFKANVSTSCCHFNHFLMLVHKVFELPKCNRQETNKIPPNFFLELVLGLWVLSCDVGFSMGSCWRIELWGHENYMRTLFINGSGQHNMTHQRSQLSFFTFRM